MGWCLNATGRYTVISMACIVRYFAMIGSKRASERAVSLAHGDTVQECVKLVPALMKITTIIGQTPLMWAVKKRMCLGWYGLLKPLTPVLADNINTLAIVRLLVNAGSEVNAYDNKNTTALMLAIQVCMCVNMHGIYV